MSFKFRTSCHSFFPWELSHNTVIFLFLSFILSSSSSFLLNKPHYGLSGKKTNWNFWYCNTPHRHSKGWEFFKVFLVGLAVLEHITKPQRPNVFSEDFGLCFWPKTFRPCWLLIYSAIKNKKERRKEEENACGVGGTRSSQPWFPLWWRCPCSLMVPFCGQVSFRRNYF